MTEEIVREGSLSVHAFARFRIVESADSFQIQIAESMDTSTYGHIGGPSMEQSMRQALGIETLKNILRIWLKRLESKDQSEEEKLPTYVAPGGASA